MSELQTRKDQPLGFSVVFDNIEQIHSIAVAHARCHGDILARDAIRENREVLLRHGSLAIAEGEIIPGDDLLHDIYVALTADYSLSNGEWIELQGSIRLQHGSITRSEFVKMPQELIDPLSEYAPK